MDLRSLDQKGNFHCGQSSLSEELLTMIRTLRFVLSSNVSSGVCVDGGITPSRRSTASQAVGYCVNHALSSASIPFGGTPCQTLARKPQSEMVLRSLSVHKKMRSLNPILPSCSTASSSVQQTGRPGIGIGTGYCHVFVTSRGSLRRMFTRKTSYRLNPTEDQPS